ncbi:MAG: penicillin-binding protein 2 [Deltaproteobacteria bacterium]|nr:penicillin-binding protein 2 [Deltaproteobacteria bacterium]
MKEPQARWMRFRIILVFGVFLLVWGGLVLQLANLQIHDRTKLVKFAEREYSTKIKLIPIRGDIYDRNGEKLAVSLKADSVYANPLKVNNPAAAASQLAGVLNLDRRALHKRLTSKTYFVWIKRQIDPETAVKVRALKIQGIDFVKESKRFYPNMNLAAHVMGFVGVDAQGLEGLEVTYDKYLQGESGYMPVLRDALGQTYQNRLIETRPSTRGSNLILTLDRRIQYVVEKALSRATLEHNAKSGMAIVMRPQTGEILALAVSPGYNLNNYRRYSPAQWRNITLTDAFDPGSTFKVFMVAGALEEGVISPRDLIYCEGGEFLVGSRLVHDTKQYGWLPVNKIIKYSSNVGAVKIGQKLGPARVYDCLVKFGFGRKSGVDLPGESAGILRPYQKWREIDAANISFGQGISVTALQLISAVSALANKGVLMRPYIVSEVIDPSGKVIKRIKPRIVRRVVSEQVAHEATLMLRQVVQEGGTGTLAEPVGYQAAGKTGTAQKLDSSRGTYSKRRWVSSFMGFMPYDDPQLAVLVVLDEPWPQFYGGVVAAPVFKEIGEKVLPLLDVAPWPANQILTSREFRIKQAALPSGDKHGGITRTAAVNYEKAP